MRHTSSFPRHLPIAMACVTALYGGSSYAEEVSMGEIQVKGQALSVSPHQPFTVQQFTQEDIRDRQVTRAEEVFREVAGMEVRGLGYGGVANSMTLRGFSGGGHGGDIGFVIDGIPLNESSSHADGYADLNVIVPLEISRMSVTKGPSSALYGNYNRAGVVTLESRKGGDYREMDVSLGSHSTLDAQAAMGGKTEAMQFNAAAQIYHTNGYRPQSTTDRGTLAGQMRFNLSDQTKLAVSARAHRAEGDTASIITQAQYDDKANFYAKDPRVQNDGTDKSFQTLRADLSHQLSADLKALAFVYGTRQAFSRSYTRPTNATVWQQRLEEYDRDVLGFGANLNGKNVLLDKPLQWVAGFERFSEDTLYKYSDALANEQPTAQTFTAGVSGGSGTLNRNLGINSLAFLGQAEWALQPLFRPTFGFRHDRITGSCERKGVETRTGASSQCADMPTFAISTPKLGFRSTLLPGLLEGRANLSEGFSLPSDTAKFTSGLAINPTRFRQTELGATFTPATHWLIDLAAFRIDSRDEVALTNAATLTYENIGKTRRQGWEAELKFAPEGWFEMSAAVAGTRAKVLETLPTTPWLAGAELTGVPKLMGTLSATIRPNERMAFTSVVRSVGDYVVRQPASATDTRVFRYGGYTTLDLTASYTLDARKRQRLYLRVANALDKQYATSSGVTSGQQTYNPAPPRTITAGLSLDF